MIYAFEEIDASLPLLPYAARRALDVAGVKVSLAAWKAMAIGARQALVALGAEETVPPGKVRRVLARVKAPFEEIEPRPDPATGEAPAVLARALGYDVGASTWRALSSLERYVLAKVAAKPTKDHPDRLTRAYNEIALVPEPPRDVRSVSARLSTHLSAKGEVHMVDVGPKPTTPRRAVAEARVAMAHSTAARLLAGEVGKGDVLATARIAGIQAAKRTPDLIPLCHVVALTRVEVAITVDESGVTIQATAEARDRTGVEMEAMVAASTAALTVYDMLKGVDRGMSFDVKLLEKDGGKTGLWTRSAEVAGQGGPVRDSGR